MIVKHIFTVTCLVILGGLLQAAAQRPQERQIDSIIKIDISNLRDKGEVPEALQLNEKVLKQALAANYTSGIINAYLSLINILNVMGRYKECLEYLKIVEEIVQKNESALSRAKIFLEYGRCYGHLGLFKQSRARFEAAHTVIQSEPDKAKHKPFLNYLFLCESIFYEETSDTANLVRSLKNAYAIQPNPLGASRLAKFYTHFKKDLDSAAIFINQGDSLYRLGKFGIHQKAMLLRNKARLLMAGGKPDQAIPFLCESVGISLRGGKQQDARDTYKLLYEAFDASGQPDSTQKYLRVYTAINDSIQNAQRRMLDLPMEIIIQKEQSILQKGTKTLYIIICLILVMGAMTAVYYYRKNKEDNRERDRRLAAKEREKADLQKTAEELQQTARQLEKQVNASFEDLLDLAKQNHPNFYVRFQEVYPDLHQRLLNIMPNLQSTELSLCAYIYLDFSTKEIAEYTFKSPKTIQNRKNSLRKRLRIDSSDDIYVWFKKV